MGAGLGGLGAAIAILLAGHAVTVLEAASEIAEVPTYLPLLSLLHLPSPPLKMEQNMT